MCHSQLTHPASKLARLEARRWARRHPSERLHRFAGGLRRLLGYHALKQERSARRAALFVTSVFLDSSISYHRSRLFVESPLGERRRALGGAGVACPMPKAEEPRIIDPTVAKT